MEFVKTNWVKLTLALLAFTGTVLLSLLLLEGPVKDLSLLEHADAMQKSDMYMLLAQLLFFVSLFTYLIFSMFQQTKTISRYALAVLSVVTIVLIVLSMTNAADYMEAAREKIRLGYEQVKLIPAGTVKDAAINQLEVSEYALTSGIYTKILSILVMGLMPLVYSVKKIFSQDE